MRIESIPLSLSSKGFDKLTLVFGYFHSTRHVHVLRSIYILNIPVNANAGMSLAEG